MWLYILVVSFTICECQTVWKLTLSDPTSNLVQQYDFPVPFRCRKMTDTAFVAFVRPLSEPVRCFSSCSTDFSQQIAQVVLFLFLHVTPLWSSGQSFCLQIQRSRVRFPALPGFLSSSGSGTRSTQPHEVNWGATWIKRISGSRSRKQRFNGRGDPLRWLRDTPLSANLAQTSLTGGGRYVGIVRSRTKATEFSFRIITSYPPTSLLPKTNKSWGVCGWQKNWIVKG
jgi:hypothetical protein